MPNIQIMNRNGRYSLCKRTPDPAGQADYERLAWLTSEQASSIVGPHTGIGSGNCRIAKSAVPRSIFIDRVQERAARTRAWNLRIGEDLVCRIDDEAVLMLEHLAIVHFEAGQPDWKSRKVEMLDDKIHDCEETLADLKARRERMLEADSPAPEPGVN